MDTLGHSEVAGMKASPNRKSSKNRNNKPPQSVKNHMIYGKKSDTRNQNIILIACVSGDETNACMYARTS